MHRGTGIVTFAPGDEEQKIALETMNDGIVEQG